MNYPEGYTITKMRGGQKRAKWRRKKRRTKKQSTGSMMPRPVTAYIPPGRR